MRLLPLLILLACAQEEVRHKWAGFAPGSTSTHRVTEKLGRKEKTVVERVTVEKVEDGKVTLKQEADGAKSRSVTVDTKLDLKKVGSETVDVDGKSLDCTIYEAEEQDPKGRKRHVKMWYCKDAPGRLVRQDQTTDTAQGPLKGTGRLTKLGLRREVNRTQVGYAVFEFSAEGADGYRATVTKWISEQVPGFLVREEHRETQDAVEMLRVTELVEFEAK